MENTAKQLKDLLIENLNNFLVFKKILEDYEQKIQPYELLDILISLLQKKEALSKEVEIFLLSKLAYICENIYEFKKAFNIYKQLFISTSDPKYLEKTEKLQVLKKLERLKFVFKKLNLKIEELLKLYTESLETNKSLELLLIERYKVKKSEILESVKNVYQIPVIDARDLTKYSKMPQVLGVKKQFFLDALCVPLKETGRIYLVCYDPEDQENIEKVKKVLQLSSENLVLSFAIKEDLIDIVDSYFSEGSLSILEEVGIEEVQEEEEIEDVSLIDSAIVQLVNFIIEEAYKRRASDIHWESLTGKKGLQVRFRVDGECFQYSTIPEHQKRQVISRIKIMANLNIAEKRLPQDGKIKFRTKEGKEFEIRVATIPTIENNEDVVMRILGGIEFRQLEEIDLLEENYQNFKKILDYPYGLILVVGPTGSGKTTTLHAALKYLNKPNKKIWTAEDPVEIVQEGLRQVQVNPKIGLTFAKVLRAFLRADPDIIMIGETRDEETAHTLIEASLTGHLVLSTLHTNSAPETITRLLGMGIDPFNFADALLGVLAQRLAKRLCKECKELYTPSEEEIERLKREYGFHPTKPLTDEMIEKATFFRPVGCPQCNYTGFKGRMAIHELLIPDEEIREYIIKNKPANEIRNLAITKGFTTLKQDGILKVLKGETTLKQVLAVTVR
ncbi:MAG: Type II secretion system protein E [Thermodesulfobacterium commune]|uniref:Type II secretion system protein E n=1 Tax=Thermodesulfobacterium commune TaxID=1741 RepID=A0A101FHY4_9BACT|nr:MAG: Type II secretion system protein E [Thermodesulfobacterium commune]HAA83968.1 type II secretion system protein E [Thermodesulfobacterium commune]